MNIGLFTDTYYPELNGVANSVFLLKKELEERGHNVYVITTKSQGTSSGEKGVFRVPSKACSFVPERRIGLVYHPKIAMAIRRMKLDIIHTHTEFAIGMFGRIMAKELFVPVVHTYHTIYEDYTHYIKKYISKEQRAKKLAQLYSKFSVRGAEELIVPTQKVAELMEQYQVKPDINVIPTGIDLSRFAVKDSLEEKNRLKELLKIPKDSKVVLYLGRISQEKNIEEVMDYLDHYMTQYGAVTFLVVGDGPYKSTLEKKLKTMTHRKQMLFAGAKPWDEITHYYQIADVFVSASTSETQGLTYIEALASGVPVVARKDRCLEGVVEQGYNGFTYEEEQEFVSGLTQILQNESNIDYAANAQISVDRFSTEKFVSKVENIYYHVTKTHRNLLLRMADKLAEKIGYERLEYKKANGILPIHLDRTQADEGRIVLGCMNMNTLSVLEASKVVDTALEQGITLFDHADIYGGGKCEEIFGRILAENKGMRQRMCIQTKCGIRNGFYDLSAAHILSSVEDSLKRLQIERIDRLLLHRPDALMDIDEIADAFLYLSRSGKVDQFGVSNFNAAQLELLQSVCKIPIVVNQMQFGLAHAGMVSQGIQNNTMLDGAVQRDYATVEYCRLHDIAIQAWSPLRFGLFEGSILDNEKYKELNRVLERLAIQYKVEKSAIAIAWILRHPAHMQVVVGTMNSQHLQQICAAEKIKLSRNEWYELYQAAGNVLP